MKKLVISLATRGRPDRLLDTVRKSVANWTHPETTMVVQIDSDDFATMAAVAALHAENPRIVCTVENREDTIAAKWNRVLKIPGDVYMPAADDDPYVTPGYDTKILEAASRFDDGIGVVYGHMANASFPTISAVTKKLTDKLGCIWPEYFPYWFVDHWADDIWRMIGRISFADVTTDQSRPGVTQEFREPAWWATWFDAAYLLRRRIATDIIIGEDFDERPHRKEKLIAGFPLIEARSRWINDNVRTQYGKIASPPPDERYQRVKAKAVAMVPELLQDMPDLPPDYPRPFPLAPWGALAYRNALIPPTEIAAIPQIYGGRAA